MRETLQSLQRQVVRQERLAAVGVLVSGVAHELNNPLQAILGTAGAARARSRDLRRRCSRRSRSSRPRAAARARSSATCRASAASSPGRRRWSICATSSPRSCSCGAAISTSSESRSTSTCRPTRKVYANFTELEQVTLNFVINAQQSIEVGGRTRGRILIRVFDAGKRVRLEVQDDGPGVTPEDEPKLFQPFFTTKPVGKGTGLGLSVSYGIIESYGGTIGHRANEWGGATFFFELPVTEPVRARRLAPRRREPRNPMTDRLYYSDPYLRAFDATVVARRAPRRSPARHARSHRVLSHLRRPAVRHRHARARCASSTSSTRRTGDHARRRADRTERP